MGFFDRFKRGMKGFRNAWRGATTRVSLFTRGFIGAFASKMTDWIGATLNKVNLDITTDLMLILPKCRYLAKNNPIVRSYLSMMEKNVLGKNGIQLQSQMKLRRRA